MNTYVIMAWTAIFLIALGMHVQHELRIIILHRCWVKEIALLMSFVPTSTLGNVNSCCIAQL